MKTRSASHPNIFSAIAVVLTVVASTDVLANDGCVKFDIPSVVQSCDVSTDEAVMQNQRLVEIIIPVSSLVGCRNDQRVQEMMVQVRGLGTGLQVVDYAPRTQLYSDIEGSIAIEQRQDRNATIGLNATGSASDVVKLNAQANTGNSSGSSERYQRIPEQKLLLASGTINRGQGAYFKFRHSPQTTLEGGHEIMLTLRVPATWRGGMLRVDCHATGKEKFLIGEGDFQAGTSSFVVATWLKGDIEARQIVEQYSMLEARIQQFAAATERQQKQKRDEDPIGQLLGYHESDLPEGWANRFMLFDSRSIQGKIKPHLPKPMQNTTDRFLASRQSVLRLAR